MLRAVQNRRRVRGTHENMRERASDAAAQLRSGMLHAGGSERRTKAPLRRAPTCAVVADAKLTHEKAKELRRIGDEAFRERHEIVPRRFG